MADKYRTPNIKGRHSIDLKIAAQNALQRFKMKPTVNVDHLTGGIRKIVPTDYGSLKRCFFTVSIWFSISSKARTGFLS
jgi:hypothetical protein